MLKKTYKRLSLSLAAFLCFVFSSIFCNAIVTLQMPQIKPFNLTPPAQIQTSPTTTPAATPSTVAPNIKAIEQTQAQATETSATSVATASTPLTQAQTQAPNNTTKPTAPAPRTVQAQETASHNKRSNASSSKQKEDELDMILNSKTQQENSIKELDIDKLLKQNYSTSSPQYSNESLSKNNSHLPPVYYESYYIKLTFNAVLSEDLDALRFFLDKHNFQTKCNEDGDNLLIYSALNSKYNAARLLIEKNIDINATNDYGITALHISAMKNDAEMAKILLSMGADLNIIDHNGKAPLDYAEENNYHEMIELLRSYYLSASTNGKKLHTHKKKHHKK